MDLHEHDHHVLLCMFYNETISLTVFLGGTLSRYRATLRFFNSINYTTWASKAIRSSPHSSSPPRQSYTSVDQWSNCYHCCLLPNSCFLRSYFIKQATLNYWSLIHYPIKPGQFSQQWPTQETRKFNQLSFRTLHSVMLKQNFKAFSNWH